MHRCHLPFVGTGSCEIRSNSSSGNVLILRRRTRKATRISSQATEDRCGHNALYTKLITCTISDSQHGIGMAEVNVSNINGCEQMIERQNVTVDVAAVAWVHNGSEGNATH